MLRIWLGVILGLLKEEDRGKEGVHCRKGRNEGRKGSDMEKDATNDKEGGM